MSTVISNDSQWIQDETEKIRSSLLNELHRIEHEVNEKFVSFKNDFDLRQPKTRERPEQKPPNRQINASRTFIPRNSILTDLFETSHIRGIRNMFAAMLLILVIQVTVNDLVEHGRIKLDFQLIFECFNKLHIALFIWLIMQLCTAVVVFMGFYYWASRRILYCDSVKRLRIYDTIWLFIYMFYIVLFLVLPCREIVKHQLAIASSFIVLLEQLRQLMKTHSFVRENIENIRAQCHLISEAKTNDNTNRVELSCPDFSHYLYFLFAPTLIYRDKYPRNAVIHWDYVLQMFGQVIAAIFYVYYVVVRFCIPTFANLNQNQITLSIFTSVLFNSIMPGSLFLLLGFYGFLHCWLNAFAEMLRFADRMFYKDWWNSTSFAAYYRTWNIVVHDWLYAYIYKEVFALIGETNRVIPAIAVVLLSATFHEYVMIFALGFFYPVMFVLFAIVGMCFFFFLPRNKGVLYNILVWAFLLIGVGLQSCFYFMEAYARKSCPPNDTFWDKLVPRSIVCRVSLPSAKLLHLEL
ncbi:unnamed protein product [Rotaria socialis]|uniref:O-acyltransferase n=5 Tax=Rotaria socialis TaxID=392032 RepID=A0A817RB01_9BILA|nr:unnamed protein product [Rotaria socialis]CAF3329063.1 unnamed protein product [Rotaria socialis]CAF3388225.1 unnamed protein product [Rotaria socialis]CAF3460330.1 unnamed protein product [Rotaria socialis]CAF4349143.1 unnamed protein product [Rotaria socialis]